MKPLALAMGFTAALCLVQLSKASQRNRGPFRDASDQSCLGGCDVTGTIDMQSNNFDNINALQFDTTPTHVHSEGSIHWDDDDKTLHVDTEVTGTALQVGQEQWVRCTNKTGAQLNNGEAVYVNGAQGQRPTVALADADTETTSRSSIGLMTQDLADNGTGYVTTFGLVRGLDTTGTPVSETWTAGETLYLSTTAGKLTNVMPTTTRYAVRVGIVLYAHATEGIIFVSVADQSPAGFARTAVSDASYATLASDHLIALTTLTASRTITIDDDSCASGKQIVVKDESGSAGTYPIYLIAESTSTINGVNHATTEYTLGIPYASVSLYCGVAGGAGANAWFSY